jgi:hypothetical protein
MPTFSPEDLRAMARAVKLEIPDADIGIVRMRLETLLAEMDVIESALGAEMDRLDPVPPVYPHEP